MPEMPGTKLPKILDFNSIHLCLQETTKRSKGGLRPDDRGARSIGPRTSSLHQMLGNSHKGLKPMGLTN